MEVEIYTVSTQEQREAAYRFRYELYVEEQGLFKDEADHERRFLTDAYDEKSRIVNAEIDGQVVGTVRMTWGAEMEFSPGSREEYELSLFDGVVPEKDIVIAGRLLIRESLRGGMLTFQLIWQICEFSALHGVELMVASCEPHLLGIYRKLGMRAYGKLQDHATNGLLIPIGLVIGDLAYLEEIKSPVLTALKLRPDLSKIIPAILEVFQASAVTLEEGLDVSDYLTEINQILDHIKLEDTLNSILGDRQVSTVLLAKSMILDCEPGGALMYEGHVSRTLYILLSGSLEVYNDGDKVSTIETEGTIVGEVAFFTGTRMADVMVGPEGAKVLAFSDRVLRRLINRYGAVAAKFLNVIALGLCTKLTDRRNFEKTQIVNLEQRIAELGEHQ